jgi:hypothetical protein
VSLWDLASAQRKPKPNSAASPPTPARSWACTASDERASPATPSSSLRAVIEAEATAREQSRRSTPAESCWMLSTVERTTVSEIQRAELEERVRVAAEVAAVAAELDRQEREEMEEQQRVAAEARTHARTRARTRTCASAHAQVAAVAAELERQEREERLRAQAELAGVRNPRPRSGVAAHKARQRKLRDERDRSGGGGPVYDGPRAEPKSLAQGATPVQGSAGREVRTKKSPVKTDATSKAPSKVRGTHPKGAEQNPTELGSS